MNYWWVNHKQTARQEIAGGYLWSPKRERNGNRSRYYDFMREARPDDVVVSFANAQIGHFGIVTGFPLSAPKPEEFGKTGAYWSDDGWLVPVSWSVVATPFRPKDNIENLRALLPVRYAPIQQDGNGNQKAYLTKIDGALFEQLRILGQFHPSLVNVDVGIVVDSQFIHRIEDNIQLQIVSDQSLSDTEKSSIIKARRGQGIFRGNVELLEQSCRVTGLTDRRLLIASHIKPWRSCETASERLDGSNGLLLAPHIDRLFDVGLISFEKSGKVLVSDTLTEHSVEALSLNSAIEAGVGPFSDAQDAYLRHHRSEIFLG
ncbi:HNH endonuclease [Loktanella salsilacus]|uniref:HNH endonuclease n=1 Tax=Loktanella salsilacus TaxID=195913 RepID=UPI0030F6D917